MTPSNPLPPRTIDRKEILNFVNIDYESDNDTNNGYLTDVHQMSELDNGLYFEKIFEVWDKERESSKARERAIAERLREVLKEYDIDEIRELKEELERAQ